jgi:hypothetical protein
MSLFWLVVPIVLFLLVWKLIPDTHGKSKLLAYIGIALLALAIVLDRVSAALHTFQ